MKDNIYLCGFMGCGNAHKFIDALSKLSLIHISEPTRH